MAVELFKKDLQQLMNSVSGLMAIIIIDKDGVPIIETHVDILPELVLRPSFLSIALHASGIIPRLGMGKCNSICCEYENYQIITFNKIPSSIAVTLVADSKANTGMLFALSSEFDPVISELRKIRV